jgi:hypothetical protein
VTGFVQRLDEEVAVSRSSSMTSIRMAVRIAGSPGKAPEFTPHPKSGPLDTARFGQESRYLASRRVSANYPRSNGTPDEADAVLALNL